MFPSSMAELEIPPYFLCPISLQIMRDPVTLSTGITYDRSSIERWIFAGKHASCPVTNQSLVDRDLIPNHTLRRLIQAWCVANASHGVERFPTPRAPVDQAGIAKILDTARSPISQLSSLQKLKSIVLESERNRSTVESSQAVDFLASLVTNCAASNSSSEEVYEALCILNSLHISDDGLINLVARNGELVDSLTKILHSSNILSRTNAVVLLRSIVSVIAPARLVATSEDLFVEIVGVLRDNISVQATKAALETLIGLCPWGRNRIKVVGAGAVHVLIELLIGEEERRVTEMVLALLDKLCGCAEGRAEVVTHAAGIAAVSKRILRVSAAGNERAVRVLWSVSRYSATATVLQEMVQVGVVQKLCMMLVADCGVKATERAREILRMHARVWRSSPCLSPQLQALIPR